MDSNLWQKLARMARRGDRVVIVEDGAGFVMLPLDEYERLSNGEASLQRLTDEPVEEIPFPRPAEFKNALVDDDFEDDLSVIPGLPDALDEVDVLAAPSSTPLSTPAGALEDEERFYLEPIE